MTLAEVSYRLDELLSEVAAMFKTGMKLTLLVRSPRAPDGSQDLVKTDDSIDEAIAALLRRKHDDKQLRTAEAPNANQVVILTRADLAVLVEALRKAREALNPIADFLPKVEAFVASRARAANDASPNMPTKHFRLADFQRALAARDAIDAVLATAAAP